MPSALSRRAPMRALYVFLGCNLLAGLSGAKMPHCVNPEAAGKKRNA